MQNYLNIGTAQNVDDKHDRRIYRALEMLPGLLAWGTIIALIILSFFLPFFVAIFIIIFDIYWLVKSVYLSLLTRSAFNKMRANMKVDWFSKLDSIKPVSDDLKGVSWKDIYHIVILPTYNESLKVVRDSFNGLANSKYPLDKMIVVLAAEERAGEHAKEVGNTIMNEFGDKFFKLLVAYHPDGLPNEIKGKGSNETWAAHKLMDEVVSKMDVPLEKMVVSVFDIDTVVPEQFFACLTWNYLTSDKPLRSSFQPIPIFTNNIWEAPAFARVFAFSTTFWQMIQQARSEQLVTFSSQSLGLKPLAELGFWQKNIVSEDSRIFWQLLLFYNGDWQTIPMYYPVYMDANVAPTFWQTLKNQYKQIRRWLYGVENNPYFLFGFLKNKKIPSKLKWHYGFNIIEKTHSSATNPVIIFMLGWLPLFVGGAAFTSTVLSFNLPRITQAIMNIAMLGLVTSALLSIILLPPRPPNYGKFKWVWMILQWALFPINFILFGAAPALDAQTRLMLGKYMGFWVTPKHRA